MALLKAVELILLRWVLTPPVLVYTVSTPQSPVLPPNHSIVQGSQWSGEVYKGSGIY